NLGRDAEVGLILECPGEGFREFLSSAGGRRRSAYRPRARNPLMRPLRLPALLGLALLCGRAQAQLTDITQTPNTINAGIQKSLTQEIGPGRGDVLLPESSLYLIRRDPFRSIV